MTEGKFDAERICRICLREQDKLFLIYDETPVEHSLNLVEILNECTSHKVERFDKMPHQMCAGCIDNARAAYRFKRTAGEAYRKLVDILGSAPRNNKKNYVDNGTQTEYSSLYPCEVCDEKFFCSDELRHHRNIEHQNKLKCKICNKMYDKLRLLQLHQAQTHQVQNTVTSNLQCKICERGFSRRDHVVRHMRNVHQKPVFERTKVDEKEQDEIESLSLLEEPEMIVMADAVTSCLAPFWSQKLMSNSETELHCEDYETNPISSDDETKPSVGEVQQKLWVAMEPEVNVELTQTNKDRSVILATSAHTEFTCQICGEQFEDKILCAHHIKCHKQSGLISNYQCNVCQRTFGRECHLQRHMQSMHLTRKKTRLSKLKNIDDTKSYEGRNVAGESSDDISKVDDADNDGPLVTNNVYNANSESDDDDEHTMDEDKLEGLETQDNFQVKTEPVEADANITTNMDMSDLPLKLEESEYKQEFLLDTDVIDVSKKTLDLPTEKPVAEISTRNTVKSRKPKVEIVREYLQKKRSTRKQRSDENPDNRCDLCQRTFSRHCHLLRHKLSHLEQKPHSCPHCPKTFARSDHLKAHITSLHGNKDYKCTICEAAFSRPDALERHKVSKHDGAVIDGHADGSALQIESKLHACEYCEKKFTSKSYLRKHTLIHTDLLYACKSCEMTFKERQLLREHEKTHTSERNFLCCICGDSFARNDYLRVHMRRHNGEKPYKCKFCCKGFPRATDVKVHERYHTGTKPNLCTLCGKGFHRAYNLTIHMRTHTGERPYKCDQCPKSFTQSNDLKAHIRRHTGERYKCNECDACFLQLYAMRHHALSVHGIHIQSKTGRLQRTGLYDDPQTQPQITTVLVAPLNFVATESLSQSQQQQETTTVLSQLHSQNSQDNTARSFTSTSVDTVVIQPVTAQASLGHEYISEYTVDLPSAMLRFQPSISNHQPAETQAQQHT